MDKSNTGTGDQARELEDRKTQKDRKVQKTEVVRKTHETVGLLNGIISILDRF